jgi:hypothetical protein
MSSRRTFLLGTFLLPLPARAQAPWGVVRELSGDVTLDGAPLRRGDALQAGQRLRTGPDGRVWFSIGADAYFLRPGSRLRLDSSKPREPVIDFVRLVAGALGATFARGARRSLIAPTAAIGIRGTGVYLEAGPEVAYFCTCFGATEILSAPGGTMMESVAVTAEKHEARLIHREASGMRIMPAPFRNHSNEEIVRLEALVGRPNPFQK